VAAIPASYKKHPQSRNMHRTVQAEGEGCVGAVQYALSGAQLISTARPTHDAGTRLLEIWGGRVVKRSVVKSERRAWMGLAILPRALPQSSRCQISSRSLGVMGVRVGPEAKTAAGAQRGIFCICESMLHVVRSYGAGWVYYDRSDGCRSSASASADPLSITDSQAKDQTKHLNTFLHMQVLDGYIRCPT
jgi:hypothetical protein